MRVDFGGKITMALPPWLKCLGRAVLWLLLVTQLGFLLAYLFYYRNDSLWSTVITALFTIIGVAGVLIMLGWLFYITVLAPEPQPDRSVYRYVWLVYIVLLILHIVIIYGLVEDADMNDKFLNPEVLKAVLCITPFLLLLLVNTADHSEYHKEAISKMSVTMTIHLFDAIDMMDIVLNGKEHGSGSLIPKGFGRAMIALACGNLFLSAWQLAEKKSSNGNVSTKIRLGVEILVNLVFLIIRAVVVSHYQGTNETIFIAKNIITIITSISQISGCTGRRQTALLLDNEHDSDEEE